MGGAKKSDPPLKFGDGSDMELSYDYRVFFTDEACTAYLEFLPSQVSSAKNADERESLADQMRTVAAVYATVIYQIYPNKPLFRKEIDSNGKLSANFRKAKEWVDTNGFDKLSDSFVGAVANMFVSREAI